MSFTLQVQVGFKKMHKNYNVTFVNTVLPFIYQKKGGFITITLFVSTELENSVHIECNSVDRIVREYEHTDWLVSSHGV